MTHQQRRVAPVECPLASLGRNTPSMDTRQYHHPLSSSPLDPQAYQMSRSSPILTLDSDLYPPDTGGLMSSGHKGEQPPDGQDGNGGGGGGGGGGGSLLSRSSSSSLDQNGSSYLHQALPLPLHPPPTVNGHHGHRRDYRPVRPRTYTPIDALLTNTYQQHHQRLSPVLRGSQGVYHHPDDPPPPGLGGLSEADRYFLEEKMDALYIQGAIRRNANATPSSLTRNQSSSSNNTERYYLENENIDAIYNFCRRNGGVGVGSVAAHNAHNSSSQASSQAQSQVDCLDSSSPHLLRRASSPETSGSDRYLLDRIRGSPAFHSPRGTHLKVVGSSADFIDGRIPLSKSQHYTDGLSRYGRFSPNLDQGYHTLVSPSPSGQQQSSIPASWTTGGNHHGSGHGGGTNSTSSSHGSPAQTNTPVGGNGTNGTTNGGRPDGTTILTSLSNGHGTSLYRAGPLFDRIPDELMVRIFEWLDSSELCNIARVCRRFESVIWNPALWKIIKIKGEENSGDRAIKTILRRLCGQTRNGACPGVERVLLADGCRLTDRGLQLLSRRCPEITHLQIQNSVTITNQALSDLVTKCTNLQHLDITGCAQITCISINPGLEPPRRLLLQYLDLTDCASICDTGIKVIARNCPLLVYLYLRRCIQVTDAGLKFIPNFCIALRELSVSDCTRVTDFGLYELAKLGATLRYLSVAKCDQVSDAGLKVIARRCYKLRYLNARGCEAVSDDSINVLARSCPRLRALDIGKCDVSDAGLRALAESCPNLKKLSLRNCDMITDRGIQCIAYYCRGLQQLNIQDCQISIEGYRAVKKYCKRCIIEHTNPGFC
ncbi:F-box/LRR-repeat protein 7 [Anopheles maculipalpis]|uniref:F-box/LRR-repeat protein 7 n=1 Tax=Anopheles maculipalpis TaxID=1496333 RepID=UPI002159B529|nr:F-box/LRR-repeat protein 7 [Anopheles maculipalpis]XP_050068730.1 F-box/LRR-repeat protein 7 [Anopheles maculipalpis]